MNSKNKNILIELTVIITLFVIGLGILIFTSYKGDAPAPTFMSGALFSAPQEEPYYLVTLDIRQSTFTLSPGEWIKNRVNAMEMTIPVDKRFYDKVKQGQELSKNFKWGSFWIDGDFSKLKVTVKSKKISKSSL